MTLRVRELTPPGAGAISVLEVSGRDAAAAAARACGLRALAAGAVRLARPRAPGEAAGDALDEALVVVLSPERVEIHLHGSAEVVRQVRALFPGARADASAATALEERAARLLERAPCESAARILLDQREGALARDLAALARAPTDEARVLAADLARRGRAAQPALRPGLVVLAGPVNAGKSTLFNALVGERRALVSEEPGTTRDLLVAEALLGNWPVRLVDTAGERALAAPSGPSALEAEGQRRARALAADADVRLWVVPAAMPTPAPPGATLLLAQSDRMARPPRDALSALADPAGAREHVARLYRALRGLPEDPWQPGRGVPFEPELIAALEAVAAGRRDPAGPW